MSSILSAGDPLTTQSPGGGEGRKGVGVDEGSSPQGEGGPGAGEGRKDLGVWGWTRGVFGGQEQLRGFRD